MRRTTSKQHVWPRLPKANTTVCCSSCIGLDSRVISNRGGQPPEMSRGRAMSGSQYQCFWQSHFATALSFQAFYSQPNRANRWQGAIWIAAGGVCHDWRRLKHSIDIAIRRDIQDPGEFRSLHVQSALLPKHAQRKAVSVCFSAGACMAVATLQGIHSG